MFTGIIETQGLVKQINSFGSNVELLIEVDIADELKVDQSISHNGVCLTVIEADKECYKVVAITETLKKTNLGLLKSGNYINLERSMLLNGRFDGHIVQGHIDQTGICRDIKEENGSWLFVFEYDDIRGNITVEKGSICVNGVSLTVIDSKVNSFSVAIIPHTFENTNFGKIKIEDVVNLEFDIIGKYVKKLIT